MPFFKTSVSKRIRASFRRSPNKQAIEPAASEIPLHENENEVACQSPSSKDGSEDLWKEAYEKLQQQEPDLMKNFQVIMQSETGTDDFCRTVHETIINRKVAVFNSDKWKFRVGNKPIHVRESVDNIVKIISSIIKDFVGPIANIEPVHAGLPLAAVCLLLSFAANDGVQRTSLLDGLECISMRMRSLAVAERIYLTGKLTRATDDLKRAIIDVYVSILEYEVRALSYFNQNLLRRFGRNAFKFDNWNAMIEKIKSYDNQCYTLITLVDIEGHQNQSQQVQHLLERLDRKNDTLIHETLTLRKNDFEFQCLECFRTMDYERYKNKNPSRVPGTCNWFLEHPRYREWLMDPNAKLLWVSADPGCGKSVLAKTLIDEQFMSLSSTAADNVCYFFFKDEDQSSKQPTNAIASFLHQLFTQNRSLIKHALPSFQSNGSKLSTLLQEQWQILLSATADSGAGTTICIIDALDECEETGRSTFIQMLRGVSSAREPHPRLKFLVTGRPSVFYGRLLLAENPGTEIRLMGESTEEKEDISREIGIFIDAKVESFRIQRQQLGLNDDAHEIIREKINAVEHRTYLWLSLIFPELADNPGLAVARLRRKLDHIPPTVDEAYEKILNRTRDRGKALRILHVVVAAVRPLTLREMNMALALADMDEVGELSLEPEITFQSTLKNSCGSFLDIKNSTVYLIHQTAKEFLLKSQVAAENSGSHSWKASIEFEDANTSFAEICVSYLSLPHFEMNVAMESDGYFKLSEIEQHDLLDYASNYWPGHLRDSASKAPSILIDKALNLCHAGSDRCNNWLGLYLFGHQIDLLVDRFTIDIEVLAVIGVQRLIETYISRGADPLSMLQAIATAYYAEQFEIENFLLRKGAEPHLRTANGETYLSSAVASGDSAVVKHLLDRGADPNEDQYGATALSRAAYRGYHEIVQILLDNGARRDSRCRGFGRTPLSYAAQGFYRHPKFPEPPWSIERRDYAKVIRILLDQGVDMYAWDLSHQTPLYYAIANQNIEAVKLFMDAGVNANSEVRRGKFALHVAAIHGDCAIAELLLSKGALVDILDWDQRTPLSHAAEHGEYELSRILLDNGADPDPKYGHSKTPLHHAAERGKENVFRMLLDKGANPEATDRYGGTPLWEACFFGHMHIVKILLDRVENPNPTKHSGETALSVAERRGHSQIVELLQETIKNKTPEQPSLESEDVSIIQGTLA